MKKVLSKLILCALLAIFSFNPAFAQQMRSLQYSPVNAELKQQLLQESSPVVQSVGLDYELTTKSNGTIRMLIGLAGRNAKAGPGSDAPDFGMPVAFSTIGGEQMVDIFIELEDGMTASSLSQLGFVTLVERNGLAAGRVPLANLESVVRDRSVRYVEASIKRKPLNDNGLADTRVTLLHAGSGIPSPYKGNNVIVGVLDSGIDFSHPDFSTSSGSRIRYLLEMKSDGTNQEWSKAQIDTNPSSVTQRDGNGGGGHGTHVAGTAAGNGRVNSNYTGVAPEADIVFVKGVREPTSKGRFSDADVVYGINWMFEKATEMGKPAVVNLSLGGNYGPLDGSSNYERMISDMVGPGRIVVAAAGNEGSNYIHVGGVLSPGSKPYETLMYPVNSTSNYVEAWYDRGSVARVRLAYYSTDDQGRLVFQGLTPNLSMGNGIGFSGNDLFPEPITHNGNVIGYYVIDAIETNNANNGDGIFQIIITNNDTDVDLSNYIWSIIVDPGINSGRLDMWYSDGAFWGSEIGFEDSIELVGNTDYTIGSPATAKKVIAVGSYVTKVEWTDIDGNSWHQKTEDGVRPIRFGDRSQFSSKGPTRDGRLAPDIMAPGERITSALSSHLTVQSDVDTYNQEGGILRRDIAPGGSYMLTRGTSMASPHIAGVVALMLQANPELDYDQVVDILTQTARSDGQTGVLPNNLYGNGKVDAYSAVLEAAATNPGGGGGTNETEELVITTYGSTAVKTSYVVSTEGTVEFGFLAGTNQYDDQGKASYITLAADTEILSLDAIRFWVSHRKEGATGNLTLNLYNGNTTSGPTGDPFYSATIPYSSIQQVTRGGEPVLVTHVMPDDYTPPVESFFISVEFGPYGDDDVDKIGLTTSQQLTGNPVPQVWEKWDDNSWKMMSTEWDDLNEGGGVQLFYEAVVTIASPVSIETDKTQIPSEVILSSNYPNPFNPSTIVPFSMPEAGAVRLDVYDATGRKVQTLVDQVMSAGRHQVSVDASSWASGVYLYVLQTPDVTLTRKMLLIK